MEKLFQKNYFCKQSLGFKKTEKVILGLEY